MCVQFNTFPCFTSLHDSPTFYKMFYFIPKKLSLFPLECFSTLCVCCLSIFHYIFIISHLGGKLMAKHQASGNKYTNCYLIRFFLSNRKVKFQLRNPCCRLLLRDNLTFFPHIFAYWPISLKKFHWHNININFKLYFCPIITIFFLLHT